jgi:peptidylprolyl isomerase
MNSLSRRTFGALVACAIVGTTTTTATAQDPENTLYLDLTYGRVVIQLMPDVAPKTVARIKELARQGFYDGTPFHRVIADFMAQGGDPTGSGTGGSGQRLEAEFSAVKHVRGTVSMARSSDVNSADSQFFICFAPVPHLDGQYTAFGQVTEGMEFVERIKKGDPSNNGLVMVPDRIVKMQVAADAQ